MACSDISMLAKMGDPTYLVCIISSGVVAGKVFKGVLPLNVYS